ncbi:MAG: hypothetical protein P1P90_05880 [Patescibacteria group bacterium]|nr:hypothetical protein [Patescibacteria group bacterium]
MKEDIAKLTAKCNTGICAGHRFTAELSDEDKHLLDAWLVTQRVAEQPDEESWMSMLLGGKPLFRGLFEDIINGKWSEIIRECAKPLDVLKERDLNVSFPILGDRGVHFLLVGIDHQKVGVYGGEKPVLLDLQNDFGVWRIDTKDRDSISIKEAELPDVPSVLLREWDKSRPKLKKARERLCDIFSICLAKS